MLAYTLLPALTDGRVYSVVVTASAPIVASVVEAAYDSMEAKYCYGNYLCLDRAMYLGHK